MEISLSGFQRVDLDLCPLSAMSFFKVTASVRRKSEKKPKVVKSKLTFRFSVLNLALGFREKILLFLMSSWSHSKLRVSIDPTKKTSCSYVQLSCEDQIHIIIAYIFLHGIFLLIHTFPHQKHMSLLIYMCVYYIYTVCTNSSHLILKTECQYNS